MRTHPWWRTFDLPSDEAIARVRIGRHVPVPIEVVPSDPADEAASLPDLERLGFVLRAREPEWEEHRVLKLLDPGCNLQVVGPDAVEPRRQLDAAGAGNVDAESGVRPLR